MECPCCGADLDCHDYYYRGNMAGGTAEKIGDIFKCPNAEKFENIEDAKDYIKKNNIEIGEGKDFETIEEVCCEGEFYYEDEQGNLNEGYPC